MQPQQLIMNIISVAVLVCLLCTLMFATKAFKAKKDTQERKQHSTRAWLFFAGYIVLNAVRIMLENGVL